MVSASFARTLCFGDCATQPPIFAASPVWAAGSESRSGKGGGAVPAHRVPAGAASAMPPSWANGTVGSRPGAGFSTALPGWCAESTAGRRC